MIVRRYSCPNCSYTKMPTTHRNCPESGTGRVVKIGGSWRCDACDTKISVGKGAKCSKCGHSIPSTKVQEVDMQL